MTNNLTKELFSEIYPLPDQAYAKLNGILRPRLIPKNEIFMRVMQRNASEYFILEGFCRSFLVNPEGEEITLAFFKRGNALSPHITRTKDNRSLMNFQALTDVELMEFNSVEFLELMIANMDLRNFGNEILKNELVSKTNKEIALASLTAKERLRDFRNEYGILENLIPHPIIASYLGITNVSLSRLRGESKNK